MSNVKNIYINSAAGYRDIGGSNTDESFNITKPYSNFSAVPKRVKLLSARIPFVWNNITSINNAFTLIENPPSAVIWSGLTVPVNKYTGSTLAVQLQTTLNAIVGKLNTYTVSYDTNAFKFTISATGYFQFNFTVADSIAQALGFAEVITTNANIIISTGVAVIQADTEIFVASNLVSGIDNGIVPWFTGTATDLHILAVIPIVSCYGSVIDYQTSTIEPWKNTAQSSFVMTPNTLNPNIVMSFSLFFLSGAPVDLKNTHWSANILLEF